MEQALLQALEACRAGADMETGAAFVEAALQVVRVEGPEGELEL